MLGIQPSEKQRDVDLYRHIEVPPGWRAEQVAQALDRSGIGDGRRFRDLVQKRSLEGYLYPGIYDVGPDFSEAGLIAEMTARFREAFGATMRRRARALGLSLNQVVTLASIVQREMVHASEAPVIAAVYLNRLKQGMHLDADPTVIYALDSVHPSRRYWDRRLSFRDLRVASPYNTYRHAGLPPAPIASPTREALEAVLYPASVDYRFFVARGDGNHAFTRTGAEHLALVRRLREGRIHRTPDTVLQTLVERLTSTVPAHVGVVVKNLATGESAAFNPDEFFTSASLYKLTVMLTAFQRRASGGLSFAQRIRIGPRAATEDGAAILARLGARPSVRNAIEQMIVVSSNAAGVTLLHRFGRATIDRILRRYGLRDTSLSSLRIVTTPRDIARLLELITTGQAVSPESSARMVRIMLRQEINDRLPKYLPDGARLAHKTGTLDYPSHDAGILFTRTGPVVIVAMTEDATKRAAATEAIARLGRVVYDYFNSYAPTARRLAVGNVACPSSPFKALRHGPLSGKTVVLDPGHGGADPGARFRFRDGFVLTEKQVDLDVTLRLKHALVARGATVYMTRCRDVSLTPIARAALANAAKPDLAVSVHLNASPRRSKDGTEVYYFLPDGRRLANYLLGRFTRPALWETLSEGWVLPNAGLYQRPSPSSRPGGNSASFAELVYSLAPTALTESVFLTNPAEANALRAPQGRRRAALARGQLLGILNYFGVKTAPAAPAPARRKPATRAPVRGVVHITATGDIALGNTPALPQDGGRSLFTNVTQYLRGDLVLGNLETSLTFGGTSKCAKRPSPSCRAFRSPPRYGRSLREAGFTVVNVANNHHHDFGLEGIAETLQALDDAGIAHTGRPGQITRLQRGRIRVSVVGFAPYPWAQDLLDLRAATRLVRRADAWADVVIVTMHAGAEGVGATHTRAGPEVYLGEPRGDAMRFAHAVIDAGADLVVGHGPHVLRGMEWYRGRLIAYSLGNFAGFGNFALSGPLGVGGILQVTLGGDGSWTAGRLVGVRLAGQGTPVPETASAARTVNLLSGTDFGSAAPRLTTRGNLIPPEGGERAAQRPAAQNIHPSQEVQRNAIEGILQLGSAVSCGGGRGRFVALTFDDGPGPYTAELLRALREEHARATFFLVGDRLARWPNVPFEEARLGALGAHTWTHPKLVQLDPLRAASEIHWTQIAIAERAGTPVSLFRPPYGAHDSTVDRLVRSSGMVQTLWSVDGRDWAPGATARSVVQNVMLQLRPGAIVLLHDSYRRTVDAVRLLLPLLRERGYHLVTVPELLALDPPRFSQGRERSGWRCLGPTRSDLYPPALLPVIP